MKLTNVALYSNGAEVATLSFRDPGATNPYTAKTIIGLDADEIVPNFAGFAGDGTTKHFSPGLKNREIILRIALNAQWGGGKLYSELRDDLYRAIASSRDGTIQLRFRDGAATVAAITGFIVKFEAPHFTETPEVQLTVKCNDALLRSLNPLIVDKTYLETNNTIVNALSTAPHGFKFNITFTDPSTAFTIQDSDNPDWSLTVTPGSIDGDVGFIADDQLWFSSEEGNKYLYLVRLPPVPDTDTDYSVHLIDKISPNSSWPILFPGANNLQFVSDGEFVWDEMSFNAAYWGV